eukprot:scaffold132_cov170-Amphora_coffeaeformis.AAC.42
MATKVLVISLTLCLASLRIQRNIVHQYILTGQQWSSVTVGRAVAVSEKGNSRGGVLLNESEKGEARAFCDYRWGFHKPALDLIELQPTPPQKQSILCYVHTISSFWEKSQAIRDTWGPGCDKLVFISNETLPDTVDIPLVAYDHEHLWDKSRKSFQYLLQHYPNFDWYFKADDDTYILVQNLRAFLAKQPLDEPLLFGHRFMLPGGGASVLRDVAADFLGQFGPLIFPSGGSGYALNTILLKNMVERLDQPYCFPNRTTIPEDVATGVCARYAGGYAPETRDRAHKQRFHPLAPWITFRQDLDMKPDHWWYRYHEGTGGVQGGQLSISKESISFHYCKPNLMYYVDAQLRVCRQSFNQTVPVWFRDLLVDSEWMKQYDRSQWLRKKQQDLAAAKAEAQRNIDDEQGKGSNDIDVEPPPVAVDIPRTIRPDRPPDSA